MLDTYHEERQFKLEAVTNLLEQLARAAQYRASVRKRLDELKSKLRNLQAERSALLRRLAARHS